MLKLLACFAGDFRPLWHQLIGGPAATAIGQKLLKQHQSKKPHGVMPRVFPFTVACQDAAREQEEINALRQQERQTCAPI